MTGFILAALIAWVPAPPTPATVVRVIDGDTLVVKIAQWKGYPFPIIVRVLGVDTAEKNGDCEEERILGTKATAFTKEWVAKAKGRVRLSQMKPDKYGGRFDAVVTPLYRKKVPSLTDALLAQTVIVDGEKLNFAKPYFGRKKEGWCNDPKEGK